MIGRASEVGEVLVHWPDGQVWAMTEPAADVLCLEWEWIDTREMRDAGLRRRLIRRTGKLPARVVAKCGDEVVFDALLSPESGQVAELREDLEAGRITELQVTWPGEQRGLDTEL